MAGKTYQRRFPVPVAEAYSAAIRAIAELGYAVTAAISDAHVVSFNTGRSFKTWAGQDLTATVVADGEGSRVILGGSLATRGDPWGGGSQLVGWGEKASIANRLLRRNRVDSFYRRKLTTKTTTPRRLKTSRQCGGLVRLLPRNTNKWRSFLLLLPPDAP